MIMLTGGLAPDEPSRDGLVLTVNLTKQTQSEDRMTASILTATSTGDDPEGPGFGQRG
jgi:hypothetical protein